MQLCPSLPNSPKRDGGPHLKVSHLARRCKESLLPMGHACSHRCFGLNSALLTFLVSLGFVCLFGGFCLLVFGAVLFFSPPLDAVLVGSVGDGKQSTLGTCRESWGTVTGGRNALPRLGSYSLINLLVRNFTVSAAGGGGGWHGHPTEQHAVTSHHPIPHPQPAVGLFTPLPSAFHLFSQPKSNFFRPNPARLSHGFPRIAS